MRFSVVVPVFNARAYLRDSVGAVLGQTGDDYEIVLVDDGSTDGSGKLCDELSYEDSRVVVVHEENAGPLCARMRGIEEARGDYVLMLDADDSLRSDALSVLSGIVGSEQPDIVLFEFTRSRDFSPYAPSRMALAPGYHDDMDVLRELICRGTHTNAMWGKAIRREVAMPSEGWETPRGMAHAEDLYQLLPIVGRARSFFYCPQPLYYYRSTPGSSTKHYKPRQLDDVQIATSELLRFGALWGGSCLDEARRGALLQYIYLLHILLCDPGSTDGRWGEYERLRSYVRSAALFGPWCGGLRIDKRIEVGALARGWRAPSAVLARGLELLKRIRDRDSV